MVLNRASFKKVDKQWFASILMLAALLSSLFSVTQSFAEDSRFTTTADSLSNAQIARSSILSVSSSPGATFDSYGEDIKVAGFDAVYGTGNRSTKYGGEVPKAAEKLAKEKPVFQQDKLNSLTRTWSSNPQKLGLSWSDEENITDLHAKPLLSESNVVGELPNSFAVNISRGLFGFFISINTWLSDTLILLANYDPIDLVSTIVGHPEFYEKIVSVIIGGNGALSPVFVVTIAIFLIGFTATVFKYVMAGARSTSEIREEVIVFFVAIVIAGIGFMPGGGGNQIETLMNNASKLLSDATSDINIGTKDELALYSWNNGDNAENNTFTSTKTQQSLLRKCIIDNNIREQFGVPVEELDLTSENWGISQSEIDSIISNLSSDGDAMFYTNREDGSAPSGKSSTANLGYFWYAAASDVNPSDPYNQDQNTKNIIKNTSSSNDNTLFVIDFISAVAAKEGSNYQKCYTILNTFQRGGTPDPLSGLIIAVIQLLVALALLFPAVFTVINKAIFSIGFVALPIIPITLLIKPFRDFGFKAVKTWVNGAVKVVVLQTFVLFIVYIPSILLSSFDTTGIVMSLVMLIGIGLIAPKFCSAIQQNIGFRDTIDRNLSSRMSNFANGFVPGFLNGSRGNAGVERARSFMKSASDLVSGAKTSQTNYSAELDDPMSSLSNIGASGVDGDFSQGGRSPLESAAIRLSNSEEYEVIRQDAQDKLKSIYEENSDEELLKQSGIYENLDDSTIKLIQKRDKAKARMYEHLNSVSSVEKAKEKLASSAFVAAIPVIGKKASGYKARTREQLIKDAVAKQTALDNNKFRSAIKAHPFFGAACAVGDNYRAIRVKSYQTASIKRAAKDITMIDKKLEKKEITIEKKDKDGVTVREAINAQTVVANAKGLAAEKVVQDHNGKVKTELKVFAKREQQNIDKDRRQQVRRDKAKVRAAKQTAAAITEMAEAAKQGEASEDTSTSQVRQQQQQQQQQKGNHTDNKAQQRQQPQHQQQQQQHQQQQQQQSNHTNNKTQSVRQQAKPKPSNTQCVRSKIKRDNNKNTES